MFQIDFQTCLDNGVITRDMKPICPVDECGRFRDEIVDFSGQYVKDADKNICKYLKVYNMDKNFLESCCLLVSVWYS